MNMNFDNCDLINETLIITNEDGSVTCIPEQDCTSSEAEMFRAFREAFPNGKPRPELPTLPQSKPLEQVVEEQAQTITQLELAVTGLYEQLLLVQGGGAVNG